MCSKPVKNIIRILTLYILPLLTGCSTGNHPKFIFDSMLVEYAESPINMDEAHPRFSWVINASQRNQTQSAYRILLTSSADKLRDDQADMWDSGKIESSETIQHEYAGIDLKSNRKYFWKIIVWDRNGKEHKSPVSSFETAILDAAEWKASWIGNGHENESVPAKGFYGNSKEQATMKDTIIHDGNSLLVRNEVILQNEIQSAKAFITGLGYYEFFVNGQRIGDHVLSPAKTPYHKYILYDTFDITEFLKEGKNALGIHLGNGWYNPYEKWWNQYRMQWFGSKKAFAQIHVTYTDGSTEIITTNKDWKWANGPLTYNCVYDGEVYDANLEQKGWNTINFNDSEWKNVTVYQSVKSRLVSQRMPAIKVNETILPKELVAPVRGMKVFDMGQNFSGWVSVNVKGNKNTRLKIRFAEDIKSDGTIDATSNENAKATAEYIFKGDGIEVYESAFTFFGFRYVELTSENGPFELLDIKGKVLHSANQQTGSFECDNPLVNKIHKATVWSQKSNMMGYPMDCPQRDERLGWLGDAQVTAEEAMFNFDMALFYENWLDGIRENQDETTGDLPIISPQPYMPDQGIEWSSTYFTLLWQYYVAYGDRRILKKHYPAMKRYMNFLDSISNDLILPMGWIGDWGSMVKGWKEGQPESVPTAFYFWNARIMADVASVLGNSADQGYFRKLAADIRDKYNKTYLNSETGNYSDGSQMANAFPLYLRIVPEDLKQKVLDNLVNDVVVNNSTHLTTGVLGTKYMPEALAKSGRADVAWGIINQKTAPSWNEMMKKYTTVCEFWTLKQSKNHVMMGSIDAWFYKYIAGIQLEELNPAFAEFQVKPLVLDSLGKGKAEIETIRGKVSSEWEKNPDLFTLKLEVPFNTTAKVYLPGNEKDEMKEGGLPLKQRDGIEYLEYKDGTHQLKVHSGKYEFTLRNN
ncbi:MAG: family 78 glycoside hydrolase catalytic domain [Prolixibacteraceae bacterium]|nr:family 78 glycoside hydrolase catalytic domain [Prolixibacteraceae bacterium]